MHLELHARTVCELVRHRDHYLRPEVIALLDVSGSMIINPNALPAMCASYDHALQANPDTELALSCYILDCMETTVMDTY